MSLEAFWAGLEFRPDPFQQQAAASVAQGRSVIVTAPTGSGKTLVAEAAIHLALEAGERAFYTTPIKALSNQKYVDLVKAHGYVGLLTGDNSINGSAPVVVMTTEVLRNMIYAGTNDLSNVGVVILDEVHYLQDRTRGAVWEEVIIHAPPYMRMVCLSATIENAEEFADWVRERRGPTDLVVSQERPVPLDSLFLLSDRSNGLKLLPTFVKKEGRLQPNSRLERMLSLEKGRRRRYATPKRTETIELLAAEDMLPALFFIFSRAGCDAAALRALDDGVRLTNADERTKIREVAERRTEHLSDADLSALDYGPWIACLEEGLAAHHAGLVPAFKETVEELFAAGLVKAVFATETLALGINMPARTVVLESLSKFNGETHEMLQPGDYTQLTGRAGRRGIDVQGYGVVLHSPFVSFATVASIASAGSHPLLSSFKPSYNMAVNLVANYAESQAVELLEASYAQFQRQDRQAGYEEAIEKLTAKLTEEELGAQCHLGEVDEYLRLLDNGRDQRSHIAGELKPGDVVDIPGGRRAGRFLILRRLARGGTGVRLLVMGTSGRVSSLGYREVVNGTSKIATLELPTPYRPSDGKFRQEVVKRLRKLPATARRNFDEEGILHPVAECTEVESHVTWAKRAARTRRRLQQYEAARREAGHGLADDFAATRRVLEARGYLTGWSLEATGQRLRFIYNESDLLLSEFLEQDSLSGLEVEDVAAVLSYFVYEARTDHPPAAHFPTTSTEAAWNQLVDLWHGLVAEEKANGLSRTIPPDAGFAELAYDWAAGAELEELPVRGLAPGDFVRVSRQLVDLCRQVRQVYPSLAAVLTQVLNRIDRGVVAAGGIA